MVATVVVVGFVVVVGDVFGAELGLGELEGVLGEDDGLLLGLDEGLEEPEGDELGLLLGLVEPEGDELGLLEGLVDPEGDELGLGEGLDEDDGEALGEDYRLLLGLVEGLDEPTEGTEATKAMAAEMRRIALIMMEAVLEAM